MPRPSQQENSWLRLQPKYFVAPYGFPAKSHSDQGRSFESNLIIELCSHAGVHTCRTTPYHAMGNGMVKRFNQTLLKMLDWKSYVALLVPAIMLPFVIAMLFPHSF